MASSSTPPSSTPPSSTPPSPLQQITLSKSDLNEDSLPLLNQVLLNHNQLINYLLGFSGPIKLNNHLDMGGKRVTNVADAVTDKDVVSAAFANSKYGVAALSPALESLGNNVMQTYRRLSDPNQREKYSSFLNDVLNTAPTANTANISATAVGGGVTTITVSAGYLQRLDRSVVPFASRSDTVTVPAAFSYTSATRTNGTVVVVTPSPSGVTVNEAIALGGATDPSFNGSGFVVSKVDSPTQFEYLQNGPNGSTSGGGYTPVNVYYYTIAKGQNKLGLVTASGPDSWSNRVPPSIDGTTIVGVAIISTNGLDPLNSAAGATTPAAGSAVPTVRRM